MSEKFYVGQVVIMQHASFHFEYDGVPAVVIEELAKRCALNLATMEHEQVDSYRVEVLSSPPARFIAEPHQLRPLRDDPEQLEFELDDMREVASF